MKNLTLGVGCGKMGEREGARDEEVNTKTGISGKVEGVFG